MKEIVNDGFAKVVKPYMDAQDKKSREIIAPVEVSPAEAAHSAGDQIIFNGILYDVIAPIAINDALSTSGAGANISAADNIEAQIKATKSQIQTAAAQAAAQNKNTQEMIAPVEEDETDASRAYAIGDQLILDGVLYNVIDAIAQHGIITSEGAGANIEEADNVTDQLSSLNGALTNEIDKAYQTDDAAITEVASNDLLPIYDTSAAAKKKIAVNNLIGGLVSNPNLLDNPWFTVNQRGFTSTTTVGYTVDRWQLSWNPGNITVSLGNNGITLDATNATDALGYFAQFIDNLDIAGKVVTASVLLADGTIKTGTGVMPTKGNTGPYLISDEFNLYLQYNSNNDTPRLYISIGEGHSVTIKAVKLELGSVSTLAMDTAPNYATELLKCQRYYVKYNLPQWSSCFLGIARANNNRIAFSIQLPVKMRAIPTFTSSGYSGLKVYNPSHTYAIDTLATYGAMGDFVGTFYAHVDTEVAVLVDNELFQLYQPNEETQYIAFSADL